MKITGVDAVRELGVNTSQIVSYLHDNVLFTILTVNLKELQAFATYSGNLLLPHKKTNKLMILKDRHKSLYLGKSVYM